MDGTNIYIISLIHRTYNNVLIKPNLNNNSIVIEVLAHSLYIFLYMVLYMSERKITKILNISKKEGNNNKPTNDNIVKVDDSVIEKIIDNLKYVKRFVDLDHYVVYDSFVTYGIRIIGKEQFEKIAKEVPEVKEFFVEEGGYYKLKDLPKEQSGNM